MLATFCSSFVVGGYARIAHVLVIRPALGLDTPSSAHRFLLLVSVIAVLLVAKFFFPKLDF